MRHNAYLLSACWMMAAYAALAQEPTALTDPAVQTEIPHTEMPQAPAAPQEPVSTAPVAPATPAVTAPAVQAPAEGVPSAATQDALIEAIRTNNVDRVRMLVTSGVDVNSSTAPGQNPVILATRHASIEVLKMLTGAGANVNVADEIGQTPLHIAAGRGELEKVKMLIALNVPVEVVDDDGVTPLFYAYNFGDVKMAEYLVNQEGAKINLIDKKGNPLAFRAIAQGDRPDVVKHMIDNKVSLFRKNTQGQVMHEFAEKKGFEESAKLLKDAYDRAVKEYQDKLRAGQRNHNQGGDTRGNQRYNDYE